MRARISAGMRIKFGGKKWSGCSWLNQICVMVSKSRTVKMDGARRDQLSSNTEPSNQGSMMTAHSPERSTNEAWFTHSICIMVSEF